MQIEGSVKVYLTWNDDANEWQFDPVNFDGAGLDWATEPYIERDDGEPVSEVHRAMLERAIGHDIDGEELAFMLGSGVIRQHMNHGAVIPAGGIRPISPALIEMIEAVIEDTMPVEVRESPTKRGDLIRGLLPLFASVDENAFRRGKAAAR